MNLDAIGISLLAILIGGEAHLTLRFGHTPIFDSAIEIHLSGSSYSLVGVFAFAFGSTFGGFFGGGALI